MIFKDWKYWKVTNLYIIYPDQYEKLLNLQNKNNDIIVYIAGSYITDSKEETLSTTMTSLFQNEKVQHSPSCYHFYIRVESSNSIRVLLPSSGGLGTSRELNFHKYYFEIPKNDFDKVIMFDKETPAPITIKSPDTKSIVDVNNYSTKVAASFPGGKENMEAYIKSNMTYPTKSYYNHIEGVVILSAEINRNGAVENIKVKQSVNDELDKTAIRIVRNMPQWNPAKEEGTPIRSTIEIPVKFQISDFE